MRKIRNLNLIQKIMLIFIISVMVPVVVMIQVIITKSKDKVIEQTVSLSERLADQNVDNLSEVLNESLDIVSQMCLYDYKLKDMLSMRNRRNAIDNIEYHRYFVERYEVDLYKNDIDLKIYYFQDTIIQNYSIFVHADQAMRSSELFHSVEKSDSLYSWGYDTERRKIFLAGKIMDSDGTWAGVAIVSTGFQKITEIVGNEESLKWAEVLLIDEQGNLIMSSASTLPVDAAFLKAIAANREESLALDYLNEYKVIHKTLETDDANNQWKFVTFISTQQVAQDANRLKNEFLFISIVVLAVSFSFYLFNIQGIANRIRSLTEQMREVANGNFREIETDRSSNEMREMTRSFNRMVVNLDRLIHENYEKSVRISESETKRREAELYALQSQIQPHFLFNTLESVRMKLSGGNLAESDEMILHLAKSLRKTLSWHSAWISLGEELDLVTSYLTVQKLRFKDKLGYDILCEPETLKQDEIPKLIIQPLVENAVLHGMETSMHFVSVRIVIERHDGAMRIRVEDNGVGMDAAKLDEIRKTLDEGAPSGTLNHIGLKNIHDRLVLLYGSRCGLVLSSQPGAGTVIEMRIPFLERRNR